jgi:hypothetical protein
VSQGFADYRWPRLSALAVLRFAIVGTNSASVFLTWDAVWLVLLSRQKCTHLLNSTEESKFTLDCSANDELDQQSHFLLGVIE